MADKIKEAVDSLTEAEYDMPARRGEDPKTRPNRPGQSPMQQRGYSLNDLVARAHDHLVKAVESKSAQDRIEYEKTVKAIISGLRRREV